LLQLTGESKKLAQFAKMIPQHHDKETREKLVQFLVSMDYLVKGNMVHA